MCASVCVFVCWLKCGKWAKLGDRDKLHFHLKYPQLLESEATFQGKRILLKFVVICASTKDLPKLASIDR